MNDQANSCQGCGAELPASAPRGLCPGCLLKRGMEESRDGASAPAGGPPPEPPSPQELAPLFPDLEILELVGCGGMGVVYKARQLSLDRLVALKILRSGTERDPAFAERFLREAQALARLNHPNIVAVYDSGRRENLFFFIMEFVEGVNLRQLLGNGRKLSPREALAIVPQVCDALQYAHDLGIVHRDIKPENLLLDRRGRVKIADFGLAKIMARDPAAFSLTGTHEVMGTPHYMAPEQVEHPADVDHRADIYSLGVVFYQMLTGELPMGRFAPPSRKVELDVRLDEVVLRALEKEPELRYQQVREIKTQIETLGDGGKRNGRVSEPPPVGAPATTGTKDETPVEVGLKNRAHLFSIPLVGVRDGRRVIHWPGVAQASLIMAGLYALVLGVVVLVMYGAFSYRTSGTAFVLWVMTFVVIIMASGIRKSFTYPLGRLTRLDAVPGSGPAGTKRMAESGPALPVESAGSRPAPAATAPVAGMTGVVLTVAFHAALLLLLLGLVGFIVPKFQAVFSDMQVSLPWATRLLIQSGDVVRNLWFLLIPVLLGIDFGICFVLRRFGGRWLLLAWALGVLVVAGLAVAGMTMVLFLPVQQTITALSPESSVTREAPGNEAAIPPELFAEPPRLRFMAERDYTAKSGFGQPWRADGQPASEAETGMMKEHLSNFLTDLRGVSDGKEIRLLRFWFSHPGIDQTCEARLVVTGPDGVEIPAFPGSMDSFASEARPFLENAGWLGIGYAPAAGRALPARVNLRLEYTLGPWDDPQVTVPVKEKGTTLTAIEGGQVNQVGQSVEGRAFVSLVRDVTAAPRTQMRFEAVTESGKTLQPVAAGHFGRETMKTERFEFDAPIADIVEFRMRSRLVRTVEFKDVPTQVLSPVEKFRHAFAGGAVVEVVAVASSFDSWWAADGLPTAWRPSRPALFLQDGHKPGKNERPYYVAVRWIQPAGGAGLTSTLFPTALGVATADPSTGRLPGEPEILRVYVPADDATMTVAASWAPRAGVSEERVEFRNLSLRPDVRTVVRKILR